MSKTLGDSGTDTQKVEYSLFPSILKVLGQPLGVPLDEATEMIELKVNSIVAHGVGIEPTELEYESWVGRHRFFEVNDFVVGSHDGEGER